MNYLVTKKQVTEMYNKVVDNYYRGVEDYNLTIYKNDNKIQWTFNDDFEGKILYQREDARINLFEWVILKEIGRRRKYTKQELIDGIQWNITENYKRTA